MFVFLKTRIASSSSSSFLSFHQESYVRQIVPSQCLEQSMAMSLAVARSWGEQAVSIMGQTSRCCMLCLMPQSQVSCSLENPHFNMFTLDRPTCRVFVVKVVHKSSKYGLLLYRLLAEWLRAWDTLTMFEATVSGRS